MNNISHYLLDAGGAGLIWVFYGLAAMFLIFAILVEAGVMALMKYNAFKTALKQSAWANIASLAVGIALIFAKEDVFSTDDLSGLLYMFGVTMIVEFLILYLFNRDKKPLFTFSVCLVMNIVTYFILYLISLS